MENKDDEVGSEDQFSHDGSEGKFSDPGQGGEHEVEVELLLNRKTTRGVTRYLVRWRGHTSADDE